MFADVGAVGDEMKKLFRSKAIKDAKVLADYNTIKKEFDVEFYKRSNSDINKYGKDAIFHYLEHGSKEGRWPRADFDPHFYARRYSGEIGQTEPFVHFLTVGRALGYIGSDANPTHLDRNHTSSARKTKIREHYKLIEKHFDAEFYHSQNPDVVKGQIDPVKHYLEYGSKEGRRPKADFDPRFYARKYRHEIRETEPFVHFLTIGRELGYRGTEPEFHYTDQLVNPDGVVPSRRPTTHEDFALSIPLPPTLRTCNFSKVAAIVHAFYPELMPEIFTRLEDCPCPIDVFISTDTAAKKKVLEQAAVHFRRGKVEVRITPNRGRDVGPMLTAFKDVFELYPAFLHLHTKKSVHAGDYLANWREYIFSSLIGSPEIIESNLSLIDKYNKGIVFAQHLFVLRDILNWGYDFENASKLLRKVGIKLSKDFVLEFPSGTMFWARTDALKGLFSLNLDVEDFDEEAGQIDGTLAHAIERSLLYFCESSGFGWAKVLNREIDYPIRQCVLQVDTEDDLQAAFVTVGRPLITGAVSGRLPLARSISEVRDMLFTPSVIERRRFVLLVPSVNPEHTFGGISTAIKIFKDIAKDSSDNVDFAIVSTDIPIQAEGKGAFPGYDFRMIDHLDGGSRFTLIDAHSRSVDRFAVRKGDIFFATAWWTAILAKRAQEFIGKFFGSYEKYIYLIQDYEPNFYGWSSKYALAESTYFDSERYVSIVNSEELFRFFEESRYKLDKAFCLPYKLNSNIDKLLKPVRREKIIVFYGRPTVHRNAFEIICDALAQWQMQNPTEAATWRILSLGEYYDPSLAHPVQNLSILGKLTLEQYAYWLNRASIGISLMLSPHPSYPPLEMAEAGLMVITNDYADRRMTERFDLTSLPYLSPELLVNALETCVERYVSGEYSVHTPRARPKALPFDPDRIYSTQKLLAEFQQPGIKR